MRLKRVPAHAVGVATCRHVFHPGKADSKGVISVFAIHRDPQHLAYAEAQCKEEGTWMEFCREACPGLSYETLRRYIRLAQAVKDPNNLDGMELTIRSPRRIG